MAAFDPWDLPAFCIFSARRPFVEIIILELLPFWQVNFPFIAKTASPVFHPEDFGRAADASGAT
jgi:hypothetical protein